MAGIKALEKRTSEMKTVIDLLIKENKELKEQLLSVGKVNNELKELRKLKAELQEQLIIVKSYNERKDVSLISK